MTRNIVNQPHPTPNPDRPHPRGTPDGPATGRPAPGAETEKREGSAAGSPGWPDPAAEESNHDSCFDDLDQLLSQSIQQPDPDPYLESSAVGVPAARPPRPEPVPPFLQDRGKQPRTSEVFRAVGPQVGGTTEPESTWPSDRDHERPSCPLEEGPAGAEEQRGEDLVVVERDRRIQDLASEEEEYLSEPRFSWRHVLLMSYSSAITLALTWILWTGRGRPIADSSPSGAEPGPTRPGAAPASTESQRPEPPPPLPPENLTAPGRALRLGDVEVTPLAILAAPLELVRSIEPSEYRREEEPALVLRLRLTNVSRDRSFAPLDRTLVRERSLRPDEPYVTASDQAKIRLYSLAIDSEWTILGQGFPTLAPSETTETIIAAEPGSAARLESQMTWRVRLRTGVYRTDLLGVKFTRDQVRHVARSDESVGDEFR